MCNSYIMNETYDQNKLLCHDIFESLHLNLRLPLITSHSDRTRRYLTIQMPIKEKAWLGGECAEQVRGWEEMSRSVEG